MNELEVVIEEEKMGDSEISLPSGMNLEAAQYEGVLNELVDGWRVNK